MMFFTSWRLTLLTLSVTPAASLAVMAFGRKIRTLSKATSAAAAEAASVAGDSLGAIRVVKAFGRESAEAEHFQAAVGKTLALGITYARANGAFSGGALATMVSVISLVFWFGGIQARTDNECLVPTLWRLSRGITVSFLCKDEPQATSHHRLSCE